MKPTAETENTLIVFLVVNPVNGAPFYVGVRRGGASVFSNASRHDEPDRQCIISAIRSAGGKPLFVQVAKLFDPRKALDVEAYWVKILVKGAIDIVNYQAPAEVRKRAVALHLATCSKSPALLRRSNSAQGNLPFDDIKSVYNDRMSATRQHDEATKIIEKQKSRHRERWSAQEEVVLCERFLSGLRVDVIAKLHHTDRDSVIAKLLKLSDANPAIRPRMLRSHLIRGAMGHYKINPPPSTAPRRLDTDYEQRVYTTSR